MSITTATFIASVGTLRRDEIRKHRPNIHVSSSSQWVTPKRWRHRNWTRTVKLGVHHFTKRHVVSNTTDVVRMSAESDQSKPISANIVDSNGNDGGNNEKDWIPFRTMRIIMAGLSMTGAAETLYLTFNKVFSSPGAICSTEGCLEVLSGPFSSFFGIPISLFGCLSYSLFAYICIWPMASVEEELAKQEEQNGADGDPLNADDIYAQKDAATRPILLGLSIMQFLYSMFLVGLLKFVIKSMCPYCLFSATLSTTLFLLTAFVGRAVPSWRSAGAIGAASSTFVAIFASISLVTSWPAHIMAQPPAGLQEAPAITEASTSDTMRIASKLSKKEAKMYGAYWCAHCYDQKQRFGKKAFAMLKYIECDKHGENTQYQLCRQKRIPGYPTWEIDGEMYPGEIDLPELERLVDEASASTASAASTAAPAMSKQK